MSTEAAGAAGGLSVTAAPTSARRSFVKRAGLAALGAAAAAPVVGGATARAVGTQVVYTDLPNTFTADQSIMARLGIGTTGAWHPLEVARSDEGAAVRVDAHTMALDLRHDTDWAGQTHDLANLYHRATGDAIFIAHQGGVPPGYSGPTGGNAGLNVLIPYYIDNTTTGRDGTVVNNRTGMQGLHIETQAVVDKSYAIFVQHFSNAYAAYMEVQAPSAGQPTGTGGALYVDDYSPQSTVYLSVKPPSGKQSGSAGIRIDDNSDVSSIRIEKLSALRSSGDAMLNLIGRTTTSTQAITVRDSNYLTRLRVDSDGLVALYDSSGALRAHLTSDGKMSLGGAQQFPVQSQISTNSAGVTRGLGLVNLDAGSGSGTGIEFNDASSQYALVQATYDNRNAGSKAASLVFQVRSANSLTERLRLNATGIGFFGASPVAKPTVTGARKGNDALTNLVSALARLGLVKDSTSP